MRYDFGIRTCTTGRPFRANDLRAIHDYGFTAVELSFNRAVSQLNWSDTALGKVIHATASRLSIQLSGHIPDELGLAVPDPDMCEQNIQHFMQIIESASFFGIQNLVFHPDGSIKNEPSCHGAQLENLVRALEKLLPVCKKTGIRLLMETLPPSRFSSRLENLTHALDHIQSKYMALCIDTNHLNLTMKLVPAIRTLARCIGEFHFNDNHGSVEEHLLPFDGIIRWDEVAEAIAAVNFDGSIILEPSHYDPSRYASLLDATVAILPRLRATFATH